MRCLILFLIIGLILVSGCNIGELSECLKDDDCVPKTCCHASECVTLIKAPDCRDIFCTEECVPGTMDCGQGRCVCSEGECISEIY